MSFVFISKVHPGYGFLSENKEFAKCLVSLNEPKIVNLHFRKQCNGVAFVNMGSGELENFNWPNNSLKIVYEK